MIVDFQLGRPAGDCRIVVAMSGGVDSSVTAALAAQTGAEVIGVTLQLYDHGEAVKHQEDAIGAAWEMTRLYAQEHLRSELSPIQLRMMPFWANQFYTTTKPMNKLRIFSGIRPT